MLIKIFKIITKFIKSSFLLLLLLIAFSSCKSTEKIICENAVPAKLTDLHGLDGCGWAIELENGQTLEPINLNAFDIKKENNKKVWVSYENTNGYVSICMRGPIVKILCLCER